MYDIANVNNCYQICALVLCAINMKILIFKKLVYTLTKITQHILHWILYFIITKYVDPMNVPIISTVLPLATDHACHQLYYIALIVIACKLHGFDWQSVASNNFSLFLCLHLPWPSAIMSNFTSVKKCLLTELSAFSF